MSRSVDTSVSPAEGAIRIPSIFELPLSDADARLFPPHSSTRPARRAKPSGKAWTRDEDRRLMRAISGQSNVCWSGIAATVGGHTPKQCRERWLVKLNPNVRRSPFEPWEDEVIREGCQRIGNHWSVIAQHLPGRTACSVKNRWYAVLRFGPIANPSPCRAIPRNVPLL
jgi:hypothetical protein